MAATYLKKTGILGFLLLLPCFAFAEGGPEGLEVLELIMNTYQALLVTGATGVLLAFIYLGTGAKWSLYSSVMIGVILSIFYACSFFLFPADLTLAWQFIAPLQHHVFLILLAIPVIISVKKFKAQPIRRSWYVALNASSILLTLNLLGFIRPELPLAIPFQIFFYALFSFLYTRNRIKSRSITAKKLMRDTSIACILCYLTVYVFMMGALLIPPFRTFDTRGLLLLTITLMPLGLIAAIAITTLSALAAIRKYRHYLND